MKLFPEYKSQLCFNSSPHEFVNIMNKNMNILDQKSNKVSNRSKLFTGYFNGMSFELKHEIEGMNSFNPKIEGIVKENINGCTVEVKFSLFVEIKIVIFLIYLFLFLSFIITFILFIYELTNNKFIIVFIIPLITFIIIQVIIRFFMDSQINYAIDDIIYINNQEKI